MSEAPLYRRRPARRGGVSSATIHFDHLTTGQIDQLLSDIDDNRYPARRAHLTSLHRLLPEKLLKPRP